MIELERSLYFDRDGKPIDSQTFSRLVRDREYKIVARTELEDGRFVSTVWLGIDHRFSSDGPPIIFETMVFPGDGSWIEEDMERYVTLEQAQRGHEAMVRKHTVIKLEEIKDADS